MAGKRAAKEVQTIATEASLAPPISILDSVIPGFSTTSRILSQVLGFDLTSLLPVLVVLYGLSSSSNFLYQKAKDLISTYLTCSIEITSEVEAYEYVSTWLDDCKRVFSRFAHLSASAIIKRPTRWQRMMGYNPSEQNPANMRSNQEDQGYEPIVPSNQYFWHKRHFFIWSRDGDAKSYGPPSERTVVGKLYCLSTTTAPIKALIAEARAWFVLKQKGTTSIYRPVQRGSRHDGSRWKSVVSRPSRPLDSVIMDEEKKEGLIVDIKKYLQQATKEWHAKRGIPYRRGYLFVGPPGTGKSSLAFALAGTFDLSIYCLSLSEGSITDDGLTALFDNLPEKCIVLLEDIDIAGLKKRVLKKKEAVIEEKSNNQQEQQSGKGQKSSSGERSQEGVSLSGLLNTIDGVSAQEGRVLIMTTNEVSALDPALIRPGRIDLTIQFDLATTKHIEELFVRTFMDIDEKAVSKSLQACATRFAAELPSSELSPAEVQGFLLMFKDSEPGEAVDNVKAWFEGRKQIEEMVVE